MKQLIAAGLFSVFSLPVYRLGMGTFLFAGIMLP